MPSGSAAADDLNVRRLLSSAAAHTYAVHRDYDVFANPSLLSMVEAVSEGLGNSSLNGTASVVSIEVRTRRWGAGMGSVE